MKFNLLYICLFFWSISFSQTKNAPRIPAIKDGNILLYKSDTLIVSYYWDNYIEDFDESQICYSRLADEFYFYQYQLHISIKNLLKKDTIYYKWELKTFEAKPTEDHTNVETQTGNKYGFESLSPNKNMTYSLYANNGDVVDFMFKEFILKFNSGKTKNITKELNMNKQLTYRKLIIIE